MRRGSPPGDVTRSQTFLDLRRSGDGRPATKGCEVPCEHRESKKQLARTGVWAGWAVVCGHRVIGTIAIETIRNGLKPTILCTCLRAIWSGTTGETLEVIRHSLPHWTIPIRGSG